MLSRIRQIHLDELPMEGRANFTVQGSGSLDAPEINAAVHVRDLTLDHELAGGLYFEAVTKGGELHLSGHSELPHGTLFVEGNVQMSGDYPATITARTDHVDLDALWRAYLGGKLTGHSSASGIVTMQGPLRYPPKWTLKGEADDVFLDLEYAKLHNVGPARFTYADEILQIESAHMVGDGTDLTGHGTISWAGTRPLDLAADGQVDIKLLSSFDPDLTASGMATVHVTLGGTISELLPQGRIEFKNASASYTGLPSGASEMTGALVFTRDRIHIEALAARTGGGTLELKGDATNYNRELNFNLTAVGKEVRLRYPPGVSSTATAELHWVGNRTASTVSGDVLVTKLAVTPGFDFGSYLERSRQSAAITSANSPLYNVKLDIAVRTAPELQMKTAVARLSGDADLRVRGSIARPSVLGRADILEGDATFNGIKFRLERGDITFANPVAIEPQVNLQATTHVRNYDLDVTVTGTPDRLNVNYRSEPPLPKSDIIALLALGRTSQESEQLQQQSGQGIFHRRSHQPDHQSGDQRDREQPHAETVRGQPDQDRSPGPDHRNQPHGARTAGHHRAAVRQQYFSHLQHQRFPELAADHSGRILFHPQCFGGGHARSERRGQLRRPHPPPQEIDARNRMDRAEARFETKSQMNSSAETELFSILRLRMIETQLRERGIRDERVLAAMARVPRHEFTPEAFRHQAYADHPSPIGEGQTISQPYIVALMLEALALKPSDVVLEVGTGSGYVTALLAEMTAQVVSMERHAALADEARSLLTHLGYSNAEVIAGDGSEGYPERAPYDAIIVSAATAEVPPALLIQLAEGGRLIIPVGPPDAQQLQLIERRDGQMRTTWRESLPICAAGVGVRR